MGFNHASTWIVRSGARCPRGTGSLARNFAGRMDLGPIAERFPWPTQVRDADFGPARRVPFLSRPGARRVGRRTPPRVADVERRAFVVASPALGWLMAFFAALLEFSADV